MADTVTVRNMRLVNPTGTDLGSGEFHLNDRPSDLNGKILGLLENHKTNSDKVLHELGNLLIARLSPKGYEELDKAHLIEPTGRAAGRDVVWSHPAFANRNVLVRNDKEIASFSLAE